ncbi:MAG: hypothetical protein RLZ92_2107 [Pseudomonadota bacterium]|jgi:hypothetical protein
MRYIAPRPILRRLSSVKIQQAPSAINGILPIRVSFISLAST